MSMEHSTINTRPNDIITCSQESCVDFLYASYVHRYGLSCAYDYAIYKLKVDEFLRGLGSCVKMIYVGFKYGFGIVDVHNVVFGVVWSSRGISLYAQSSAEVNRVLEILHPYLETVRDNVVVFKVWSYAQGLSYEHIDVTTDELLMNIDVNLFKYAGADVDDLLNFFKSRESLLLITGIPGTGKSKLCAALIALARQQGLIGDYIEFVKGREVIKALLSHPDNFLKPKIWLFDDLDVISGEFSRDTSDELAQDFISMLLTMSDGVIPQKSKFIVTTNIPLKAIDEALLRPGRLYESVELKKFNARNAGLDIDKEVTLAEFMALREKQRIDRHRPTRKIGF